MRHTLQWNTNRNGESKGNESALKLEASIDFNRNPTVIHIINSRRHCASNVITPNLVVTRHAFEQSHADEIHDCNIHAQIPILPKNRDLKNAAKLCCAHWHRPQLRVILFDVNTSEFHFETPDRCDLSVFVIRCGTKHTHQYRPKISTDHMPTCLIAFRISGFLVFS